MNADIREWAVQSGRDLDEITYKVIACAYKVSNALGAGFLEKVYENAMMVELRLAGLAARQQVAYHVRYRGQNVGDYVPDIVVSDSVIVEVKACVGAEAIHRAQCINYLRASGLAVALLLNFHSPRVKVIRIVDHFAEARPKPGTEIERARTLS